MFMILNIFFADFEFDELIALYLYFLLPYSNKASQRLTCLEISVEHNCLPTFIKVYIKLFPTSNFADKLRQNH